MPAGGAAPRFCSECGSRLVDGACTVCGPSKVTSKRDGIVGELVEELAFADRRVVRTVRDLLSRPGRLTVAWSEEGKGTYLSPVRLFITCTVAYLLAISLGPGTGGLFHNAVSAARDFVVTFLDAWGRDPTAFIRKSEGAVAFLGGLLDNHLEVVLGAVSVPLAAVVARFLFRGRSRPWSVHMVFSLHVHSFALIVALVLTAAVWMGVPSSVWLENVAQLWMAGYAGVAAARVYGLQRKELVTGGIAYVFAYGFALSAVLALALLAVYVLGT